MSLRNNKITRLNRYMMLGTLFLGILVLGCVFAFLYLSFNPDNPFGLPAEETPVADSVIFMVSDSILLEP
ncbi:MAG: hypothetical protein II278_00670 [Bacteroidaceae bacterium]|nr:hypothetical protein [Bacteroidaceae bacterium]